MNIQIVLAGIGGQGILFASRFFSELGLKIGVDVMGSETHGMSQRGGSVVAHVKLGVYMSPMIMSGAADLLYSFHEMETYKNLRFLRPGGLCFVNLADAGRFNAKIIAHLKNKGITFKAYDASSLALKMGSMRSANIALIGYSAGTGVLPFQHKDLKSVLQSLSRRIDLENNLAAFQTGFLAGQKESAL